MSKTPFMPLYTSDYLGDTGHLSTEEHGAYLLILMQMWNAGGSLPNEPRKLARVARCTTKKWMGMADTVLAFFEDNGVEITSARLTKERLKVDTKSDLRRSAGAKGGAAKALKTKKAALANAIAKPCHLPEPEPYREEYKGASAEAADLFEECWKLYQSCPLKAKAQKKKPAQAQWSKSIKRAEPERILKAIGAAVEARMGPQPRKFEDRFPTLPDMWRWLRDDCWADVERELAPVEIETIEASTWDDAFRAYCANASWPRKLLGPAPHEAGCTAPRDKIAKAEAYLRSRNPETADSIVENSLKMEQAA